VGVVHSWSAPKGDSLASEDVLQNRDEKFLWEIVPSRHVADRAWEFVER